MTDMPTIDPRVVGPPPERRAARVVGEMVHSANAPGSRASWWLRSTGPKAVLGSPIAQRRLADRLRKAAGRAILDLRVRSGKRGNFVLDVFDPARDDTIVSGDPMPEKPWLECSATVWPYKNEKFAITLLLMTHHAMLAERARRFICWTLCASCSARTPLSRPLVSRRSAIWSPRRACLH
jgi:hypothetical protein